MTQKAGMKEFRKAPIFIKRQATQMLCVDGQRDVIGDDRRTATGPHYCYD